MAELNKEMSEKVMELIEVARTTGKVRKGANEATKVCEKKLAKVVAIAADVQPPEIIMHIPILCDEKEILFIKVDSKEELGAAAGLDVGTAAVAVIDEGKGKNILKELQASIGKKDSQLKEDASAKE